MIAGHKRVCDDEGNIMQPMEIDELGLVLKKHRYSDSLVLSSTCCQKVAGPTDRALDQQ